MIKDRTVLVLGAGANMPYSFPSGPDLSQQILGILRSPDCVEYIQLKRLYSDTANFKRFEDELAISHAPSIDTFLEYQTEFRNLAKLCIAIILLRAEARSQLGTLSDLRWYHHLGRVLTQGCPIEKLEDNPLSIITFNYDRSLEAYLVQFFKARYALSFEKAAKAARKIGIFHVHGDLGALPFNDTAEAVPYGAIDDGNVQLAAQRIRIIHEVKGFGSEVQSTIQNSQRILFFGCAYHIQNMQRLGLRSRLKRGNINISGTTLGLNERQTDLAKEAVGFGFHTFKCDVATMFTEHLILQ